MESLNVLFDTFDLEAMESVATIRELEKKTGNMKSSFFEVMEA